MTGLTERQDQVQGGPKKERETHARFGVHRARGEWFHPHPELLAFIAAIASKQ